MLYHPSTPQLDILESIVGAIDTTAWNSQGTLDGTSNRRTRHNTPGEELSLNKWVRYLLTKVICNVDFCYCSPAPVFFSHLQSPHLHCMAIYFGFSANAFCLMSRPSHCSLFAVDQGGGTSGDCGNTVRTTTR